MSVERQWWDPRRYLDRRDEERSKPRTAPEPEVAPDTQVSEWARDAHREGVRQAVGPDAWVHEPWEDLSRNWPGKGLIEEANQRAAAGSPDGSWRQGAQGE